VYCIVERTILVGSGTRRFTFTGAVR